MTETHGPVVREKVANHHHAVIAAMKALRFGGEYWRCSLCGGDGGSARVCYELQIPLYNAHENDFYIPANFTVCASCRQKLERVIVEVADSWTPPNNDKEVTRCAGN